MANLSIDDQTAESLAHRAQAMGMTLNELLNHFLEKPASQTPPPRLSSDELDALLDQEASEAPLLPPDFSRADIYAEHD